MPGSFTTDLTLIKAAEATTTDYTSLGSFVYKAALNDDLKVEGTNATYFSATSPNTAMMLAATASANLDLSASTTHVFVWIKNIAWPSHQTKAKQGVGYVVSSDSSPTLVSRVDTVSVSAGGTGYTVGDTLTVAGGTGTAATIRVDTVSGGVITAVSVITQGLYTAKPTTPNTVTGGTGTGASITLLFLEATSNSKSWFLGGSDTESIRGWTNYAIDINGTPDLTTQSPVLTSVDRLGVTARASGTISNKVGTVVYDVSRYGTGSTINDGTGRAPVTMADYVAFDNANARAWGIVVQQEGIYFLAGKLNFGTTGQSAETIFWDRNQTFVWQDFPVSSSHYEWKVVGASGQETTFQLGSYNPATNLTSNGCTIRGSGNVSGTARTDGVAGVAHSRWTFTASAANQVTKLYNSNFTEMLSAALAYNAISINVTNCTSSNGSPTLTTTGSFDTSGIVVGMKVTGTNIPANTYVSSIASATSLTMDKNATGDIAGTANFTHNNEIRGCTFSNSGAITTNCCVIDNCTFQNVKTGAPISASYAIIVTSTTEGNRITNSKFIACNRALKISGSGSFTFNNLTFSANSYDIENATNFATYASDTVAASASTTLNSGGTVGVGQSFTGSGGFLSAVRFFLKKTNSPTGNAVAKIYTHSGTYGTSSVPTGTALATSDNLNVALLSTTQAQVPLNFSGSNKISLINTTNYVVTLEYSGGDGSNNIQVGYETTNGHGGNYSTYNGTTWTADSAKDASFYVFTGAEIVVNATAGSNPGTYICTAGTFDTTSCYSYNANTSTFVDETTDINSAGANDVALVPIQATTQGDLIYFGHNLQFDGVTLNIGTAGNYSNITLNWEYYNGSTWTALTVTDTSNSFKTSGTQTISFTKPSDWTIAYANSVCRFWIRARTSWSASQSVTTAPLATQGFIADTTINNSVTVALSNIVTGSRVTIYQTSNPTNVLNQTDLTVGTTVSFGYNYLGDLDITVRVRKSSSAPKYLPYETTGTIEATGFSLVVNQITDTIA
ncbi:hypothetical protein HZA76_00305 [Candidatus Roizmanbacteria bacterium]|nr:hypothetical protein [Candidatus Roizmanbacteria bacterium]